MKRVIKYYDSISGNIERGTNPGILPSNCSIKGEILPILCADDAGSKELRAIAKELGLKLKGNVIEPKPKHAWGRPQIDITHAIKLEQPYTQERWGKAEQYQMYLGLVDLTKFQDGTLPVKQSTKNKVSKDQAIEIVNRQEYGVSDYGETVDKEIVLVKEDWNYFHYMPLLGYSRGSFERALKITEHGFSDDTSSCSECGLYDNNDNGYTYNFRYIESQGMLGIHCGCFEAFCNGPDAIEHYADNTEEAMELTAVRKLDRKGVIEFVERFIGGMTDGRGGHFNGEYTREGTPKGVLAKLKAANPTKRYLFTHDESGQFQTYFSVWEIK